MWTQTFFPFYPTLKFPYASASVRYTKMFFSHFTNCFDKYQKAFSPLKDEQHQLRHPPSTQSRFEKLTRRRGHLDGEIRDFDKRRIIEGRLSVRKLRQSKTNEHHVHRQPKGDAKTKVISRVYNKHEQDTVDKVKMR